MEVVLPSIRNLFPDLFPAARAQDTPALPTRTSTPPAHVEDASDPHSTQNRQAAPLPLNGKGRRYTCAVCPKAFARPSSLAVHMRVHTGAKPYECPHQACGRSYQTKSNLELGRLRLPLQHTCKLGRLRQIS
ncbi:C2H2-type zinc finger [Phanerochaete sordida]|uniref:C2H2-type zinc finger n=1 Tax=Phanerochaete sordida TaxID=48140 RepID=A0A9P3GHB0_9APHY|nr:C2H2-type zinc finger [Phanerochaete sordida]